MTDLHCKDIAQAALGPPMKRSGGELLWRCPRRDDEHPSLSANEAKNCWLCGPCGASGNAWQLAAFLARLDPDDKPEVTAWLRERRLISEHGSSGRIVATYDYVDESGKLLFQVVQYEPKNFKHRQPDGRGGWIWNLDGVRRVIYRLPEVITAESVLVVEGEKDVETARKLGLAATCNPGGAGKWKPEYAGFLKSKRVAVIGHADAPGLAHGRDVARQLLTVAENVKLIEALPGGGKDLTDYVSAGGSRDSLLKIIAEAPTLTARDITKWQSANGSGFTLTPLGELLKKPDTPVDYVWDGCLVAGTVSGLVAKPKVGKGTLARNLCLAIARGEPCLELATKQGECIYLALEEREDEIKRDFRAMGADGSEPIFIHAAAAPQEGIQALCELVRQRRPRLVVIDPIVRLARIQDEKTYAETHAALGPLIDVPRETGTHVLLLHHSGKSPKPDLIDSPLGSTAIAGVVATLVVLKRTQTYRTVATAQRIGQEMPETVLRFDPVTRLLSISGTRDEAETHTLSGEILEFLEAAGEPRTEPDITEGVKGKTKFVRRALRQLVEQGKVSREGAGRRGDPYRFLFSCSPDISGTREQETEKPAETRINVEGNLVPEKPEKEILVPAILEGEF